VVSRHLARWTHAHRELGEARWPLGGEDLWMTTRATRSLPWAPLVHLDESINTPGEDAKPEFSADGSTLLFMSTRSGGQGFFDIWDVSVVKTTCEGVVCS